MADSLADTEGVSAATRRVALLDEQAPLTLTNVDINDSLRQEAYAYNPNISAKMKKTFTDMLKTITINQDTEASYLYAQFDILQRVYPPLNKPEGTRIVFKARRKNSPMEGLFAIKQIKIQLQEKYSGSMSTASTLSISDTRGIGSFFQHCQEAVLQHDVFDHPSILKVTDRWISTPSVNLNVEWEVNATGLQLFSILEFLDKISPHKPALITKEVGEALDSINGCSLFLVMDYYDMSLKEYIDEYGSRENIENIENIVLQNTFAALTYVHQKGFIHMDIKPENILIRQTGNAIEVVLADFGLSKELVQDEQIKGNLSGTFPYNTCPVQYYSPKIDFWALGLVLYYIMESIHTGSEVTRSELASLANAAKGNTGQLEEFLENSQCTAEHLIQIGLLMSGDLDSTSSLLDVAESRFLPTTVFGQYDGSVDNLANDNSSYGMTHGDNFIA